MKPVDGQIFGSASKAISDIEDFNGKKIEFKRNEDIIDDVVFEGEGSDGKKYSLCLQKKSVIVSISDPEILKAQGGPVPESELKKENKKQEEQSKKQQEDKDDSNKRNRNR